MARANPSSTPPAVARARDRSWLPPLLIAAAAFAAYANGLRHPFVFDDLPAIVTNPSLRSLAHLGTVLTPPADGSSVTGRPLVNLSFALNYALGGTNPLGYHLGNLLIHVLVALALFGLVRRTLARPVLAGKLLVPAPLFAGAVALLWVLHPLQTESVSFTVQRTESLMGLCYLATLYGFARSVDSSTPVRWQAFTLAVCALGMTAKEVMVTAPVLVLLYDRTFAAGSFAGALRTRRVFYAGLAATWLPLLWLLTGGGGTRGASAGLGLGVSWWSYALKQCEAITLYLKLTVWPHPLVLDYGTAVVTRPLTVLPQLLFVAALVAATLVALRLRPVWGFVGAAFFLILAPSSSIVPLIGQTVAEHRMYLPLAAGLTGLVAVLFRLPGKLGPVLVALAALACGFLTAARNTDYRDALTLWRDTVAKQPDNYRAHYNLAVELARTPAGQAEAIAEYGRSLRLEPNYPEAHNNLAIALAAIPGRETEALTHYAEALRLKPDYADAHFNLALALGRIPGQSAPAIAHYETALQLRPDDPEAHNNLAVELAKQPGRLTEAAAHYESALRLRPDYPEARLGLANVLAALPGRSDDAVRNYEAVLRLQPGSAAAHYGLAVQLSQRPDPHTAAIAEYETVLRLEPGHTAAHFNLANELARLPDRLPDAIAHYEAAIRLQPDFVAARNNLAGAYYRSGRLDDAITQLTAILRLEPDNRNARRNLEMLRSFRRP